MCDLVQSRAISCNLEQSRAFVIAPTTTSVGQGDLGWLAGAHDAPVTREECLLISN